MRTTALNRREPTPITALRLAIFLLIIAILTGCSAPSTLHQTWPDGAVTDVRIGGSFCKDNSLKNASFMRMPNGTVVLILNDYQSTVNAPAVSSITSACLRAALAVVGLF